MNSPKHRFIGNSLAIQERFSSVEEAKATPARVARKTARNCILMVESGRLVDWWFGELAGCLD
jgi:hypothetical protein